MSRNPKFHDHCIHNAFVYEVLDESQKYLDLWTILAEFPEIWNSENKGIASY